METIIVPVDFTDASKRRATFALKIALKLNSKIVFTHAHNVIFKRTVLGSRSILSNSGMGSTLDQQRLKERQLTNFVNGLDNSVTIENHVGIGTTESVLNNLIEKEEADLVVIGVSKASSIEKLILGHSFEKISRTASCSVLVLPDEMENLDLENVSLALDSKWHETEVKANVLFSFLKGYGSKLNVINVPKNGKRPLKEEQVLEQHSKPFNAIEYSFDTVRSGNVKKGILRFLRKQSSGLLAIVYQGHGFFKRLFDPGIRRQMISDIKIPLLILK